MILASIMDQKEKNVQRILLWKKFEYKLYAN